MSIERNFESRPLPLPPIPGSLEAEASVPSLLRRMIFGRPQSSPIVDSEDTEHAIQEESEEFTPVDTAANTDIYIKNVNLLLNGAPLQSLSTEDAKRDFDYSQYFLFLKATGCVQTGFSHGIGNFENIFRNILVLK